MLINVATTIEHCTFTGANNYASAIAAGGTPTATVRASGSAAANAGNMTEAIQNRLQAALDAHHSLVRVTLAPQVQLMLT